MQQRFTPPLPSIKLTAASSPPPALNHGCVQTWRRPSRVKPGVSANQLLAWLQQVGNHSASSLVTTFSHISGGETLKCTFGWPGNPNTAWIQPGLDRKRPKKQPLTFPG